MSADIIPVKETLHYHYKGVESKPAWAYNDARSKIVHKWAGVMKDFPDTSNVNFQDTCHEDLGGSIVRVGHFSDISVTNGAITINKPSADFKGDWEIWLDIQYELQLYFVPSEKETLVKEGLTIADVNHAISNDVNRALGRN
ncbi:hypothetical protein V499_00638 [Pseudogymnoascus sp. VKM F-103]|nr:hypothetical protein V499_00638 [Pseudogymnoascus sp. VKM F-103]